MQAHRSQAEAWLKQAIGPAAGFREGQWDAIEAVAVRRERVLVVQKTGWGKSLVYFLATRLIRERGGGPTVLVSPLLALMRNQVQAAHALGLRAETINSTNRDDHEQLEADLLAGKIDLVLISPERLGNKGFRERVWEQLSKRIGLLVVDEVHCISDWGHDFRPDYRRIMPILEALEGVPVLGTTATANDRVVADVAEIMGQGVTVMRGPLTRESLSLFTHPEPASAAFRLAHLTHLLSRIKGSGIIYCLTTRDCMMVSEWLNAQGFQTKPYFSGVEQVTGDSRPVLEEELLRNQVKALVASVALGMGFDKPDLSFVIHYQLPNSIVSYYQQIGRAGRAIERAWVFLMRGHEDRDIHAYFMGNAFPREEDVRGVLDTLAQDGPQRYTELLRRLNVRPNTLDKILLHLELEGIAGEGDKSQYELWKPTPPDFARWARVTAQREAELEQMEQYAAHEGCLMQFLARSLNDIREPEPCGKCMNCRRWKDTFVPDPALLDEAQRFLLQGKPIVIEPRRKWMGEVQLGDSSKIAHVNETGLALAYWGDEGWGRLVREGKVSGHFSPDLVEAAASLMEREWPRVLAQRPWITSVPSLRHPRLVQDFARSLAARLRVPYADAVRCLTLAPEQRDMQNSYQQLANVAHTFETLPVEQRGPVILVDDTIGSGWTLTVIGWLLREQGVPAVYPFVLAESGG